MRHTDDENEEAFLRLIIRYPLATCLMLKYCQHNDLPMLKRIHRSFGRWAACRSVFPSPHPPTPPYPQQNPMAPPLSHQHSRFICSILATTPACCHRRLEAAKLEVVEAYKCPDIERRVLLLQKAVDVFKGGVAGGDKRLLFFQKVHRFLGWFDV
jgi:hypothetical protein